jgi:hypothetical protein
MEIGQINIDFTIIPDFDPKYLIVGDISKWYGAENLPATISITPPGSIKPITETFQKHKLNIFNSVNLGLSCLIECEEQKYGDLSDGVWTILVKSGYTNIEKTRYFLKTDIFVREIDEIYIRAGLEYDMNDKQIRKDLRDMEFLKRTAEANCRRGDFYKADRDFTAAEELLSKYKECKNCI